MGVGPSVERWRFGKRGMGFGSDWGSQDGGLFILPFCLCGLACEGGRGGHLCVHTQCIIKKQCPYVY